MSTSYLTNVLGFLHHEAPVWWLEEVIRIAAHPALLDEHPTLARHVVERLQELRPTCWMETIGSFGGCAPSWTAAVTQPTPEHRIFRAPSRRRVRGGPCGFWSEHISSGRTVIRKRHPTLSKGHPHSIRH